jgi:hypothetical protein
MRMRLEDHLLLYSGRRRILDTPRNTSTVGGEETLCRRWSDRVAVSRIAALEALEAVLCNSYPINDMFDDFVDQ